MRTRIDDPRVEKYRPDTLDDVSGHQDILATITRFVDTNVSVLIIGLHCRLRYHRGYRIFFSTVLQALAKPLQS